MSETLPLRNSSIISGCFPLSRREICGSIKVLVDNDLGHCIFHRKVALCARNTQEPRNAVRALAVSVPVPCAIQNLSNMNPQA